MYSFTLRRSIRISGNSKYYINDCEVTQNAVKNKLRSEGIDLSNNRFLILQGEVEQISQMKPKSNDCAQPGLLEYLEDIIGSNKYLHRINELVQEYSTKEEVRHERVRR